MKSATPKVLHKVAGLPMLGHVLKAAEAGGADEIAVVVGPRMEAVGAFLAKAAPTAATYVQEQRLGTAHAVLTAKKALAARPDQVLVMYGDTPLVTAATLKKMRAALARGADLVVLGFRPADPLRYGRLIMQGRQLTAIREFNDATRRRTRHRLLQCRRHGLLRRHRRAAPEADRQRQCQGRILPDRPRRTRQQA